jgi:hypothetical protein
MKQIEKNNLVVFFIILIIKQMCENGYRKRKEMKIFFFYGRSNIEQKTKVIAFIRFHGQNNERRVCLYMDRD